MSCPLCKVDGADICLRCKTLYCKSCECNCKEVDKSNELSRRKVSN